MLLESIKDGDEGLSALCDRVLVVDVPTDVQIQRAARRDGQSSADILAIINRQMSREQRLAYADDVLDNSGGLDELYRQIDQLHQKYLALAAQNKPL